MSKELDAGRSNLSLAGATATHGKTPDSEMKPDGARHMNDGDKSDEPKNEAGGVETLASDVSRRRRRKPREKGASMRDPNGELQSRQRGIGLELRRMFDEIVEEPIPTDFINLLDEIDRRREQ